LLEYHSCQVLTDDRVESLPPSEYDGPGCTLHYPWAGFPLLGWQPTLSIDITPATKIRTQA
jgi:hypothetical protein